MNQKLIINTIGLIALIGLAGGVAYVALNQQQLVPLQNQIEYQPQNPAQQQNQNSPLEPDKNIYSPPSEPANNSGNLNASFMVYFVDRVTGRREPIANFPILQAGFGPSCNPYDLGPGESPPELGALCSWRTKLVKEKVDVVTDSNGRAVMQIIMPPATGIARDVLSAYKPYADEVRPEFNSYSSAQKAGWNYQKFTTKVTPRRVSRTAWDVEVTITGFAGDRP